MLNIIGFQTQKQLVTLNNIQVLIKCVLIDLRARNSVHAKTSLRARCVHARRRARNLSRPAYVCFPMFPQCSNFTIMVSGESLFTSRYGLPITF